MSEPSPKGLTDCVAIYLARNKLECEKMVIEDSYTKYKKDIGRMNTYAVYSNEKETR